MTAASTEAEPAYTEALLRHFADLRDGTHGGASSRTDKERLFTEAVGLLDQLGAGGKVLAGGSDLVGGVMKDWVTGKGMPLPTALVDITTIPELRGVEAVNLPPYTVLGWDQPGFTAVELPENDGS